MRTAEELKNVLNRFREALQGESFSPSETAQKNTASFGMIVGVLIVTVEVLVDIRDIQDAEYNRKMNRDYEEKRREISPYEEKRREISPCEPV